MKTFIFTLLFLTTSSFAQIGQTYFFNHAGKKYMVTLAHTFDEIHNCEYATQHWNGNGLGPCSLDEVYNLLRILQRIAPGDETIIDSMVATMGTCTQHKSLFYVLLDKGGSIEDKKKLISEVRGRY